jgi:aspartyl-tRNA synthetase
MDFIYCGKINKQNVDQEVTINGWIKKNRRLGSLIFLDVGDRYGIVQVVVEEGNPHFEEVYSATRESVVTITGTVGIRKNINKELPNGDVEILLKDFKLLSKANQTPLIVEDETDALEDVRLTYRYLDLRRPIMRDKLIFRSKFISAMRNYLLSREFTEVETPNLSKATPEGARDYLVPTRIKQNYFYALPQSPQIYKQLLMVSGLNRYFQIARCFRDEDLRSDRQPEFTQLDLEMSFTDEKIVMDMIEKMFRSTFKKTLGIELKIPFEVMSYDVAMNTYGCDKPDLRYDLPIQDATKFFSNTNFNIVKTAIAQGKLVKYILVKVYFLNKNQIEQLRKYAKDNKAFDVMYLCYDNQIIDGSIQKAIEPEIVSNIFKSNNCNKGTLLMVVDTLAIVNQSLGAVRNELGNILNLKQPNLCKFVWIVD